MYKFANGIVVFDEETRDNYIKAGYKLVEEQLTIDKEIKAIEKEKVENIEDKKDNGTIPTKFRRSYKVSK